MTREEIRAAVLDAIVAVVPGTRQSDIKDETPIRDQLDMDSMDFINFVVELDERLAVAVPESDYGRLATVNGCIEYLARTLAGGPPPVGSGPAGS
ncbi:MAG: acyl carrier protein [Gemmatimonadota bacterium]|nr:acyl carrier protein [Gemmatimonadota bacterium]MDH5282957.1 acyl carrier protein [Gemmatimonadota bacterium]